MSKQLYIDFDAYIRQGEPDKREKAKVWRFCNLHVRC